MIPPVRGAAAGLGGGTEEVDVAVDEPVGIGGRVPATAGLLEAVAPRTDVALAAREGTKAGGRAPAVALLLVVVTGGLAAAAAATKAALLEVDNVDIVRALFCAASEVTSLVEIVLDRFCATSAAGWVLGPAVGLDTVGLPVDIMDLLSVGFAVAVVVVDLAEVTALVDRLNVMPEDATRAREGRGTRGLLAPSSSFVGSSKSRSSSSLRGTK